MIALRKIDLNSTRITDFQRQRRISEMQERINNDPDPGKSWLVILVRLIYNLKGK